MARIIHDVEGRAVSAARELLADQGIEAVTMRTVAGRCGVAVGTMYNYFPSKEYLIGSVILEDWKATYAAMESCAVAGESAIESIRLIYELMLDFAQSHRYLYSFHNWDAAGKYTHSNRHAVLLGAMEAVLQTCLSGHRLSPDPLIVTFLGESILNSSVKQYGFAQIEPAIQKLLV